MRRTTTALRVAVMAGLAAVAACVFSGDADRLADQLRDDPMVADDLGVPDYHPGEIGSGNEMGRVIVDRVYRGPDRPLQTTLEDLAARAGWTAIEVRCRRDERGFRLTARRRLDERVASLSMDVFDEDGGEGRNIWVEVAARIEGGTDFGVDPDPSERCE